MSSLDSKVTPDRDQTGDILQYKRLTRLPFFPPLKDRYVETEPSGASNSLKLLFSDAPAWLWTSVAQDCHVAPCPPSLRSRDYCHDTSMEATT